MGVHGAFINHPSPHVALVTFSEKTSRDTFSSGTIEDVVSTIDGLIEDPIQMPLC